jgi:uncharacterized protein
MTFDTWQWALAILGAFLVGLSKTGIVGLGILTVAIFATVLPARESVGVLLIILIAGDIMAVLLYRRKASWPHLVRLFPWAAGGIFIGTLAFGQMNDAVVHILIGIILIGLVALELVRRGRQEAETALVPPKWLIATTGLLTGFTTMIANAAGPLMIIYLLAMRLPKLVFIGTTAWFFLILNLSKVPLNWGLGLITWPSLVLSFKLIPVAILGGLSGRWIITYIDQRTFEVLALVLTFAAGLRLLFV